MTFAKQLEIGQVGESMIASYLRQRGASILPVYEKEIDSGKGPRFYTARCGNLVAPDMLVFCAKGQMAFVEAKRKTAFSYYRDKKRLVTGFDLRHYQHYIEVAKCQPSIQLWVFFLHSAGHIVKDHPKRIASPSGLYAQCIQEMSNTESHRHPDAFGRGKPGVYWGIDSLKKIAEYEVVEQAADEFNQSTRWIPKTCQPKTPNYPNCQI